MAVRSARETTGGNVEKLAESKRKKGTLREYAEAILIAILLALVIRSSVVQAFKIPSGSMKQTLLIGDHILVNKFSYGLRAPFLDFELIHFGEPKRGDVVVFRYPVDHSKDFIKRVIGLPGDSVRIVAKKVFVNGELISEPYVRHVDAKILPADVSPRDHFGPVVVPAHQLFVMGDNRDESYDSRFWEFVDTSALKGKAFVIYWSWNSGGVLSLDPERGLIRWNRLGSLIH
jgi:signal peptidase I